MPEPKWYTKQGPDGKWYKTQAASPEEATQKLLRTISPPRMNEVEKLFPRSTPDSPVVVGPPHHRTGLAGIEDTLSSLKDRLDMRLDSGIGKGAGDYIPFYNIPGGLLKVARGVTKGAEGQPWQATKDVVGGGMQALSGPASFVAPEANVAIKGIIPMTERAGEIFSELEKVAGHVPVDVNKPGSAAAKIWDMAAAGGTRPKIITDFMRRVTSPGGEPMTYSEMRRFYQNATRLSFDESNRLTPNIKRMMGEFTQRLGDSLWEAAQTVGKGGEYNKAMKMYRQASRAKDVVRKVAPYAAKAGLGAAAGAGGLGAYKLYETLK